MAPGTRTASRQSTERAALSTLWRLILAVQLLGVLGCSSCAQGRGPRGALPAPPAVAQAAFAEAQAALADPDLFQGEALAREALGRALQTAPDWVAPARQLDDLERTLLLGPEVYQRRLEELSRSPFDARALYLLGRLEVGNSSRRFSEALGRDSHLAWAAHGLSVVAEAAGQRAEAYLHASQAAMNARGDYELGIFAGRAAALAPLAAIAERELTRALERLDAPGPARDSLELTLARLELSERLPRLLEAASEERVERGLWRALAVIERAPLEEAELRFLVEAIARVRSGRSNAALHFELERALAAGPNAALAEPPSEWWGPHGGPRVEPPSSPLEREFLGELAVGHPWKALELRFGDLPAAICGPDGLPSRPQLRALCLVAREFEALEAPQSSDFERLTSAALDAGLGPAARVLLEAWRRAWPAGGVAERARLGQRELALEAFLGELGQLTIGLFSDRRVFALEPLAGTPLAGDGAGGSPSKGAPQPGSPLPEGRSLDDVLAAIGRLAQRYGEPLGIAGFGPREILATPRIEYGGLGEISIPSPVFIERDEALGHGPAGEPVPGLPDLLGRIGRAGLFGKLLGRATDGTVLKLVGSEHKRGEHLGVPFEGLVLYADGSDADGAKSQSGGRVSGAALHEGYWIDLSIERGRAQDWNRFAERWFAPGASEARARALSQTGLDVLAGERDAGLARVRRRSLMAPLGEASRVRLALLEERQGDGSAVPRLELDELLQVVRTHEEGHLCDRTRYLPLGRDPLGVLALALGSGLIPGRIEQRLEYRAELTALAAAPEPRFVLVEILEAAEVHPKARTVHGRAYAQVAQDLVDALDRAVAEAPRDYPQIDPERTLVHQLHRLDGETIRRLALELARVEGLVR